MAIKAWLVTIVSHEEGQAHCRINQNARLSLGYFEKGTDAVYSFNPENKCLFVFVISGSVTVNGEEVPQRDALGVWDTRYPVQ